MSDSSFELNCNNINGNNDNIIDEFMITRLKYTNANDNDNDYFDKKNYINKSCELNNNNINNRKCINYHLPTKKSEEIYKIYQKNIDYFKRKYNQKKKIVLNTIKYPNKLSNLNSKLPEVKYDNDYAINAINNNKNKKIHKIYLSPNGLLPQIKKSKKNSKKVNEEIKNDINKDNNTNNRKLDENLNNFHKRYLMNTLQMKINQNHPFNYKGKIDIIIEE